MKIQRLSYLRDQQILDQTLRQKALDLKQSFLNLGRLDNSIEANKAAVLFSEEEFKLQDESFKLGAGTFLERLRAQQDLFNAKNLLVQAQYDYQIELARLEQTLGGSLSSIDLND
mgnify:CR=1 FL=1